MATIKLGRTKSANKLISYADKRATVLGGVDCLTEYAKVQMRATRELWGKNDGVQAHHVIQSFKPGEITPERANELGQELARKMAAGFECAVYTHTDKEHIHNHIVINSVSYEDGRKFHAHGMKALNEVRQMNDELCEEHGLSVVEEKKGSIRYTLAEKLLVEKGKESWKDEIREAVDECLEDKHVRDMEDLKTLLKERFGVEMKERGNTISYKHPEQERFVRGSKLGYSYEKGGIMDEFERKDQIRRAVIEAERAEERERKNAEIARRIADERGRREAELRRVEREVNKGKQKGMSGYER